MRYNELKYDTKTYTEQWKIDEILIENGFKWLVNAEIENARLEILKDTLVWNAGIWYNGSWEFGVFRDGEWKYGTWEGGVWYNGKWKDGTFKAGIIYNGIFVKGKILGGEIKGGKFIDCEISSKVKEYVEGEKEQEELQAPTIDPVRVQDSQVQVIEEKNNTHKMSKIKDFKGFINELNDWGEEEYSKEVEKFLPDDIFSYLDINTPEYATKGEYVLIDMTEWDDRFDFNCDEEDIRNYFDGGNVVEIRTIGLAYLQDDAWELKFDYQDDNGNYDNFIRCFIRATDKLMPGKVFIDSIKHSKFLESITIKESIGDIEPQFAGNDYANVNVTQVAGGIELSSYSKTDIYNMKQIHGGEVVEKDNGLYVLYVTDKK